MKVSWNDILLLIAFVFLTWLITSCKTCEPCIPETIVKDSIHTEYKLDSIYLYERDSIYVHQKADTVYVNKYITRYKDVYKVERDTITLTNDIVKVQHIKYIPKIVSTLAWIGGILLVLIFGWIIWRVYKIFSGNLS